MLQTCLDEAGKWQDRHLSFAGWISDSDRWGKFQEDWFGLFDDYRGITAIHMSQLMRPESEVEYQKHTFTERHARQTLINRAVDIINKHTLAVVAVGVDCDSYRQVVSPESQKSIGRDTHVFAFRRTMKHICDALVALKWPWPTSLIFDDNTAYGKECYGYYSKAREENPDWKKNFGSITFADDEIFPPLQAADMLAWYLRKKHGRSYDGRYDSTIRRLLRDKPSEDHFYDEESLRELDEKLRGQVSSEP